MVNKVKTKRKTPKRAPRKPSVKASKGMSGWGEIPTLSISGLPLIPILLIGFLCILVGFAGMEVLNIGIGGNESVNASQEDNEDDGSSSSSSSSSSGSGSSSSSSSSGGETPTPDTNTATPTPTPTDPTPTETATDPDPTPTDPGGDNVVFEMSGRYEFDGGLGDCFEYPHLPRYDIDRAITVRMWFKRTVFNEHQFLMSKGNYGDRTGYRFMLKEWDLPWQKEHIQWDVGDTEELNYYKSLVSINTSEWHYVAFIFNGDKTYVDAKGTDTHGVMIVDGDPNVYYMARSNTGVPPISTVVPYTESLYIGRHFTTGKFILTGAMANITMWNNDQGIDTMVADYHATKHLYQ